MLFQQEAGDQSSETRDEKLETGDRRSDQLCFASSSLAVRVCYARPEGVVREEGGRYGRRHRWAIDSRE